jgi:hypothetical protein
MLKENVVRALEARAADMRVCEREPRMSDYFDAVQQRTQTDSQEVEDGDITTGVDRRADIIFKGAERARPIMVDVTSISGLSKIVNLRQVKEYSKLWDIEDTTRASCESLHFFGVELTGCIINLCKQMSNLTGEGPT